ncbi:MAG: T9SS type A sorting domain-containing protein [Candidatus Fermentibacteraceae bacterium]
MNNKVRYDFADLDIAGRLVWEQSWWHLESGAHSFPVSIEPSGVYLVFVETSGQRLTSRLAIMD